jgi:hypothetical protein
MERETKQSVNLINLEERIKEFVIPLEAFVKGKKIDELFTALGLLYYLVCECNKNKNLPVDELYAKLKPVDDIIAGLADIYAQMVSTDAQIGLIALIKAFTNKTQAEILSSIVSRKNKIVPSDPIKQESPHAKKQKGG